MVNHMENCCGNVYRIERAYTMLNHLIRLVDPEDQKIGFEGELYSNLFAANPPFPIDANLGIPAAVSEILAQRATKDLYLRPALPRDKWQRMCEMIKKARGWKTVNIFWDKGVLQEVGLVEGWKSFSPKITLQRNYGYDKLIFWHNSHM